MKPARLAPLQLERDAVLFLVRVERGIVDVDRQQLEAIALRLFEQSAGSSELTWVCESNLRAAAKSAIE